MGQHCIDLGCGTGLSGLSLRNRCARLTGVDVSQGMLDQAQRREVYDELRCLDLVAFLARQDGQCDLLVATDVVMYLLALKPFMWQCQRVLKPGGILAFSTEKASEDEAPEGWLERSSERLAHCRSFILSLAEGFELLKVKELDIRKDGTSKIRGDLFVFQRTPT